MSVLYRDHRGSLADAMKTVVEVESFGALYKHLSNNLAHWGFTFPPKALHIEPYSYDERVQWDTHIVTIDGWGGEGARGVVGFTSGPLVPRGCSQNPR